MVVSIMKMTARLTKIRYPIPAILLIGMILSATAIMGLPRFSARVEQKCNLCHMSPTGGGMRNGFGSQYFAMTEMAVHKTPLSELSKFQPQVSETVSLGLDLRTQYIYDELTEQSTFFQMEGSFYASAQLDKRFSVTLDKGLYSGFEIFGTGYILPANGYFRVGKFQPAYGWRFADHTSFVREKMLWPPNSEDTGIEFGIYPDGISTNIGFFNGSGGMFDDGKGKAVASRFEFRHHVGPVGFAAGGSYYFNDTPGGERAMYGPLFYLNVARIIYLGEVDWLDDKISDPDGITKFATSHKANYMLTQGVWVELLYDFYDPDIDLTTGSISRYGLGVDYFPYGFLEIEPNFKIYDDSIVGDEQYILYNVQFHFFF
jgi:hypothetical protein